MATQEPKFLADHQSVVSLVGQLHSYFNDSYSQYQIKHSTLLSQLHAAKGEQQEQLRQELREIEEEISIFGILSDSLSVADRILHMRSVMKELGTDSEVYRMHNKVQP
jgi:hypothetical protein